MSKILVTGASGYLGAEVIKTLLREISAAQLSVLTRNEGKLNEFQSKGFNAFLGSYQDIAALEMAMADTEAVLLISSGDQGDRVQEHKNVIETAKKMGVKNIAYTSRCLNNSKTLVNTLMTEHFQTENYIKDSGLKYTFFRNILYMDVIPQFIGGARALEKGIFLPAGNGKVSFALRSEMGEAMANVLLKDKFENRIYHFTGNNAYTFYDIAQVLSRISGNEVKYTNITVPDFQEIMIQRNLPPQMIQKMVAFITDIKHQQESKVYSDLEMQLGRKPAGLEEGLRVLFER